MSVWSLSRFPLGALTAVVLLLGCSGPLLSATSTGSSTRQDSYQRPAAQSRISPLASAGDLVYAVNSKDVDVFTYPGGAQVGTLTGFKGPVGICADTRGNVWIVDEVASQSATLYEYLHGGSSPVASLQDAGPGGNCSVDRSSGNLAVANQASDIAVYTNAQGSPIYYSTRGVVYTDSWITYDGSGDLYFRSYRNGGQGWLPSGSQTVLQFYVKKVGPYGWDGQHLVISAKKKPAHSLVLVKLNGGSGQTVGTVPFSGCNDGQEFSIEGSELAATCPLYGNGFIAYYHYPAGGSPIKTISGVRGFAIAISVGSSRPRVRK